MDEKEYYVIQNNEKKFFFTDSHSGGYPTFTTDYTTCDKYSSYESAERFMNSKYATESFPEYFDHCCIKKVVMRIEDCIKAINF